MKPMDADKILAYYNKPRIAPIYFHQVLASTNDEAKRLAKEGAPEGTVVLAAEQTAGRGRQGKSFFSPKQSGIYMSIVTHPDFLIRETGCFTTALAVTVARVLEKETGLPAGVKWVNDVYIHRKKVCGILCEAGPITKEERYAYVVAGIGINVGRETFTPELAKTATSIENELYAGLGKRKPDAGQTKAGQTLTETDPNRLIVALLHEIEKIKPEMNARYLEESRKRSVILGQEILVTEGESVYRAIAREINAQGHLLIDTPEGRKELHSGEVSIHLSEAES